MEVYDMTKYAINTWWSNEDNCYLAEVPELSGCMADGETLAELMENVQVVIQEWIDRATELGWDIPEPKGRLMYAKAQ